MSRTSEVPRDRILECRGGFPRPDKKLIKELFKLLHEKSEEKYNGDGSWGKGCSEKGVFDNVKTACKIPLLRKSYSRLSAYLSMSGEDDSGIYLARAGEAAEFLCARQREDGYFPYYLDDSGWPLFVDSRGIMYVTGFSASALVDAYLWSGKPSFLDSVFRACVWGARFPSYWNYNYNSIVISMLARGWRVFTSPEHSGKVRLPDYAPALWPGDDAPRYPEYFLGQAVSKTLTDIIPGQQPNGGYPGHNSWVWYHGIITWANALVLSAAGEGHPACEEIKKSLIADINYLIINRVEDGGLYANHETDAPAGNATVHVIKALLEGKKLFGERLDCLLRGVALKFVEQVSEHPGSSYNQEKKTESECAESHMEGLALLYQNADGI